MPDNNNLTDEQVDAALAEARARDILGPNPEGVDVETQLEFAIELIAKMAWEVIRSQLAPTLKSVLAPPWEDLGAEDRNKLLEKTRSDIRDGATAAALDGGSE